MKRKVARAPLPDKEDVTGDDLLSVIPDDGDETDSEVEYEIDDSAEEFGFDSDDTDNNENAGGESDEDFSDGDYYDGQDDEEEEEEDEEDNLDDDDLDSLEETTGEEKPSGSFTESKLDDGKRVNDEYDDYDSSDEEDIRNTIGNVPVNWYDDLKHLGYDWDGNQIAKPEKGDSIDDFLKRVEDPNFWRTVKDLQTGKDIVLSDGDINQIKRMVAGKIPDEAFDEYAPWVEWFTSEVMKMPVRKFPEHKRSFLPSRSEARKVSRLVHALKMGWIKTKAEDDAARAKKEPRFYMLWSADDKAEEMRRIHKHISAPKRLLPGHAESYNPPPEYLFDEREMKKWDKQKDDPKKRKLHFVPRKYPSLRSVPAYSRYIKERFLRCLDLYLCPRAIKMKLTIEPEALVPKLPSPKDLQPFPNTLSREYKGHGDMVRCLTIDKTGKYLASGSDDKTVKIWEVNTGRCVKTIETDGVVRGIEWCPNASVSLILIASDARVILLNPNVGDPLVAAKTDAVLADAPKSDVIINERVKTSVRWTEPTDAERAIGFRLILDHFKEVNHVAWHGRGDYFATVMTEGQNRSVLISQLSKRRSQIPFSKSKGLVQSVLFHPVRPLLFVATQRHIRVYDLMKQTLVKKLLTNSKWISCMDVHPNGDNLLVGTYDRKVLWFDLDLSTKPYQTLRLHGTAVRGVAYHRRYPLFASGSDDRSLIVSHGMVYNDLLKNPLIVPLKRFQNHDPYNDFGIFAVKFHPIEPWVFSSGADSTIKLYSH